MKLTVWPILCVAIEARDQLLYLKETVEFILKKLIFLSDVFVQNFRPGTIERMGLEYEEIKINSNLIYVSISGFGSKGLTPNKEFMIL